MQELVDVKRITDFAEAAYLNKQHDPWVKRRVPAEYAECEITSCDNEHYWYAPFVGIKFLAELRFMNLGEGRRMLREAIVVRLVNSKAHTGRTVGVDNFKIL